MNVKRRLIAENEVLKMQYHCIVIQMNAAVSQLHKKCDTDRKPYFTGSI